MPVGEKVSIHSAGPDQPRRENYVGDKSCATPWFIIESSLQPGAHNKPANQLGGLGVCATSCFRWYTLVLQNRAIMFAVGWEVSREASWSLLGASWGQEQKPENIEFRPCPKHHYFSITFVNKNCMFWLRELPGHFWGLLGLPGKAARKRTPSP